MSRPDIRVDSLALGMLAPSTAGHRHGADTILFVAGWIGRARFSFDLPTRAGTEKDKAVSDCVEALVFQLERVAAERMGLA